MGSDKTHLTNHQGDKECHNVFMTCGNIKKDVRLRDSERAWMHVGQIPVVKWKEKDRQGVLNQRMLHRCLEIICQRAMECSHQAEKMVGPDGLVYKIRLLLAAYIADLPEALDLACRRSGTSPVTTATKADFGNPSPCPLQTAEMTLAAIKEVLEEVGEEDILKYNKAAKKRGLNGVTRPFWRKWFGADPSDFYVPDALHQWFKFFIDHVWKWGLALLGKEEMDKRLSVLQQVVGYRHFGRGVTRFKQHTGREQRDLMRYFVAIIAGHPKVSTRNLIAFRAFIDFVYIAQYKSHSAQTLQYLEDALKRFHAHLPSLSHLRNGKLMKGLFLIPKLELMHNVVRSAKSLGSSDQFNSEQVEKGHIIFAKVPYKSTNKKDYASQMCRYTDRQEKIRLFDEYLEWFHAGVDHEPDEKEFWDDDEADDEADDPTSRWNDGGNLTDEEDDEDEDEGQDEEDNDADDEEDDEEDDSNKVKRKQMEWRTTRLRLKALRILMLKRRKRKVIDAFQLARKAHSIHRDYGLEVNETTAFKLTSRITYKGLAIKEFCRLYKLDNLKLAIVDYYRANPGDLGDISIRRLDAWDHFRIQLHAARDSEALLPLQKVEAVPPNSEQKFGRCNFVLVKNYKGMEFNGVCGTCILSLFTGKRGG